MFQELLGSIQCYLDRRCTLQDMEGWVLSNLQSILDSGDKLAINIANQIDADLVELSESLIDETTVQQRLQTYLADSNTIRVTFGQAPSSSNRIRTDVADDTVGSFFKDHGPVVDHHLKWAFV